MSNSDLKDEIPPFGRKGFIRLSAILAPRGPIPVSKSTWWAGVKSGRFPKPVKLGPGITAWDKEDINILIELIKAGLWDRGDVSVLFELIKAGLRDGENITALIELAVNGGRA
jgi:prophage regulatory protein